MSYIRDGKADQYVPEEGQDFPQALLMTEEMMAKRGLANPSNWELVLGFLFQDYIFCLTRGRSTKTLFFDVAKGMDFVDGGEISSGSEEEGKNRLMDALMATMGEAEIACE